MNLVRTSKVALGSFLLVTAFSVASYAKLSKIGNGSAGFKASGPGVNITGTTSDVAVADDGSKVTVEVKLTNISTGISLRDQHTRNYLEADKFPAATLEVPRSQLRFPEAGKEASADATGALTIHGVKKETKFHYDAKKEGDAIIVRATMPINMNDFGIKTPSYLGIGVKPNITIFADFQAKDL